MSEFKIPPHSLNIDEPKLLKLIEESEKFTHSQKIKILENIPKMKQWQVDDLITDLESWKGPSLDATPENPEQLSPDSLLKHLNERVVGQEGAKDKLALAFYEHKILKKESAEYLKPNLVVLGPTGSGKTFMISELARVTESPFVIANAAGMVSAGYVGTRLDDILTRLYLRANRDLKKAESGIILIDEFDKMVDGGSHDSVGGVELQQEFLKLVEGGGHICKTGLERDASRIEMKTDNILFIFSGAFVKLEEIIRKRLNQKRIGFKEENQEVTTDQVLEKVTHSDIVKFGIIPEMVSRIQTIAPLKELTVEDLFKILKNDHNPYLNSLKRFFDYHNNRISFDDDALYTIAEKGHKKKLGARGLRGVVDQITLSLKFEATRVKDKDFIIKKDRVLEIVD